MSVYWTGFKLKLAVLAALTGTVIFCLAVVGLEARDIYWGRKDRKVVVIDPGHGGNDTGAKGPRGTLEKDVTLSMARLLEQRLGKKYQVFLTRDGDYSLALFRRTGTANHQKADLFLSLHTAAGFLNNASGIAVSYQQDLPSPEGPVDKATEPADWDETQTRHLSSSKLWAKMLKMQFDTYVDFTESIIQSAPLVVLKGADMPALMIEVGHLTNPAEEKALLEPETLERIGMAIGESIDDYFSNVEK